MTFLPAPAAVLPESESFVAGDVGRKRGGSWFVEVHDSGVVYCIQFLTGRTQSWKYPLVSLI